MRALALSVALLGALLPSHADAMCWDLGHSPFVGVPTATRVDPTSVLVDWGDGIFAESGSCDDVDFLVKSNPRSQPSKYKLSEFTMPGQRKAVIKVDTDGDYVFQARIE